MEFGGLFRMSKEWPRGVVGYYNGNWKGVCKTYQNEFEVHITQTMAKTFYKQLIMSFKSIGYPWLTKFIVYKVFQLEV